MVSVGPVGTKGVYLKIRKDMSHALDKVKKMFVGTLPDDQ
jgi:hypothetical protein